MTTVRLTTAATKLARKGHPWFFSDDLATDAPQGDAKIVRLAGHRGEDLGLAFYSAASRLRVRRCGGWPGAAVPGPEEFFRERLTEACAQRAEQRAPEPRGVRLVHGDADGLPGLVVDRYADCLVLQSSAAVIERHLSCIVPWLREHTGAVSVLARNDLPTRRREGMPEEVRLLDGKRVEEVVIEELGIRHRVRPFAGHKTGFYLDQRLARQRVQELAAGRRVLDLFSYQGAFSLAALRGGASSALAIDQSAPALERASAAAAENGLVGLEVECAEVFAWLRTARRAERRFDLVVLDPPAFAKSRGEAEAALAGYRDLNRLALRLLAPGGYLLSCSCSHHVSGVQLEGVVRQAAAELPFRIILRERIPAAPDHPIWVSLPQSEYLKVLLLQRPCVVPEPPRP